MINLKNDSVNLCSVGLLATFLVLLVSTTPGIAQEKPRVIISTDIGGTDDDDFQSLIHYLMYADRFHTEGLISSPHGRGRVSDIHHILGLYEQDLPKLRRHSLGFPSADELRAVTKQGELMRAPLKGWRQATEGSKWIVECAKRDSDQPLWVLVWGGLEDVAQALKDAPEIADRIRVYWIGGPNKKWSADAYHFVVANFPHLWMIEANATYRGWFVDDGTSAETNVRHFYEAHIRGGGNMGQDFKRYYGGVIKMGDTPSVAYLLQGDPEDPSGPSWGGSFVPMSHSSRRLYTWPSVTTDTLPTFSLMEWEFKGPAQSTEPDEPVFQLEIADQLFDGYDAGGGVYRVRFASKGKGRWDYVVHSNLDGLGGVSGTFVTVDPWPGERRLGDFDVTNWWTDSNEVGSFDGGHQGAGTVSRYQREFMNDWALRWEWLKAE